MHGKRLAVTAALLTWAAGTQAFTAPSVLSGTPSVLLGAFPPDATMAGPIHGGL
jgi:hypothetical protein